MKKSASNYLLPQIDKKSSKGGPKSRNTLDSKSSVSSSAQTVRLIKEIQSKSTKLLGSTQASSPQTNLEQKLPARASETNIHKGKFKIKK